MGKRSAKCKNRPWNAARQEYFQGWGEVGVYKIRPWKAVDSLTLAC